MIDINNKIKDILKEKLDDGVMYALIDVGYDDRAIQSFLTCGTKEQVASYVDKILTHNYSDDEVYPLVRFYNETDKPISSILTRRVRSTAPERYRDVEFLQLEVGLSHGALDLYHNTQPCAHIYGVLAGVKPGAFLLSTESVNDLLEGSDGE